MSTDQIQRQQALAHAVRLEEILAPTRRFTASPEEIVQNAEVYLKFLTGPAPSILP